MHSYLIVISNIKCIVNCYAAKYLHQLFCEIPKLACKAWFWRCNIFTWHIFMTLFTVLVLSWSGPKFTSLFLQKKQEYLNHGSINHWQLKEGKCSWELLIASMKARWSLPRQKRLFQSTSIWCLKNSRQMDQGVVEWMWKTAN